MNTQTYVARLVCDEAGARRLSDAADEMIEGGAVAAFEAKDGWEVALHFAQPPDPGMLDALRAAAGLTHAFTIEPLQARDWVRASLEGLKPVAAGRWLVHGAHDRATLRANQRGIEIEAALAFGTGHHGTTRGCLLAFERVLKRGARLQRVLDVGTGTGVLAIAAAKVLPRDSVRVLATEIDAASARIARENARGNGVQARVRVFATGSLELTPLHGEFDLIFANILLPTLRAMATPLAARLRPGGTIILSGLLPSHGQAAIAAYRARGLALENILRLENWLTLTLRKR